MFLHYDVTAGHVKVSMLEGDCPLHCVVTVLLIVPSTRRVFMVLVIAPLVTMTAAQFAGDDDTIVHNSTTAHVARPL